MTSDTPITLYCQHLENIQEGSDQLRGAHPCQKTVSVSVYSGGRLLGAGLHSEAKTHDAGLDPGAGAQVVRGD